MRVPSQTFAAAAIALLGAFGAVGQEEPGFLPPEVNASRLTAGEVFPDLVLPSLDGTPRAISELRGEKLILHVFASW